MHPEELVIVQAYEFEDEAHLARSVLDAEGIESKVLGSETAGFGSLTNEASFQLVVRKDLYERAKQVLDHAAQQQEEEEEAIPAWKCECGEEVEIFSDEMQVECSNCGLIVYNDMQSCIQWCKYARECVGEELYNKLKKEG